MLTRCVVICLIALSLGIPLEGEQLKFHPEYKELLEPPEGPPQIVRIATFNVHYALDIPTLIRSIERVPKLCSADILLIQEIESYGVEGLSRAEKLAQALRMNYAYAPARRTEEGGTHGLAVLSRFPLKDIKVLPLPQFDLRVNTRRRIALAARVDFGTHSFRVFNVHLDTRLNSENRLKQIEPVVQAALTHPTEPVIIGGDFNTNPFRWAFHLIPVFYSNQASAVDKLMRSKGFKTPFADAGSTSRKFIFNMRLDSLYPRNFSVIDFGIVDTVESSDHQPLWIDLRQNDNFTQEKQSPTEAVP